jgi:lactate dehydrogenase-like 2-hydroxyacid dehydrogenase
MSDKPTVWISRKLSDNTIARAENSYNVILNAEDTISTAEQIIEMSKQVDAIIPCHSEIFNADVAAKLGDRLKIIANHSVGVDLPALQACGITVTNTPDVLSDATAEIAMLLLLGAARRAAEGDHMVRTGQWDGWSPSFMVGHQVTGKKIGIVGMGRVGQVMAKRARGFDMEVHYYNRTQLNAEQEQGATFHSSLDSLLSQANYLSLHCPATPETTDLINAGSLQKLPEDAILVNTARGALVDEDALVDALKNGKLAAAGLDCFKVEPGGNPALSALPNVFMLPHIGSATFETRDAMGFRALDNLDAFFAGKAPNDKLV